MNRVFTAIANEVARLSGRPLAFVICCLLVVVWGATGPLFHYSDTWQLVINTSTTIVTFLMVFLIQNTQNRDNAAVQAKLDELIRVTEAQNGFIGIEKLTDTELEQILDDCEKDAEDGEMSQTIESRAEAIVEAKAAERKAAAKPARKPAGRKPPAKRTAARKTAS